jgi:hypothetical protein
MVAAGVEGEHAGREDQPVDGEGQEPGGEPGLAVGGDEFVGVPVGDDGGDRGDAATAKAVVILTNRSAMPASAGLAGGGERSLLRSSHGWLLCRPGAGSQFGEPPCSGWLRLCSTASEH